MKRAFVGLAVAMSLAVFQGPASRADDVCGAWAKYIWEFTPQSEVRSSEMKKVNVRESIGGLFEKSSAAYPFPGIPRSLDRVLSEKVRNKVRTLYSKYVLLDRKIDDLWRDRFNNDGSALQAFFHEREQAVQEMTQVAREAKSDLIAWGVRDQDCFAEFEGVARKEGARAKKEIVELTRIKESCVGQASAPGDENRTPAAMKSSVLDRGQLEIYNSTY